MFVARGVQSEAAKMTAFVVVCVFAVAISSITAQTDREPDPMTPECLRCLCEAASGCKSELRCDGGVCGPFQITRPYWLDAGKPVVKGDQRGPNSPSAYADCANDMECSERAVTAYMKRYAQDCNQDGEINCIDYASIHRLGPGGCKNPLDQVYFYKFSQCIQRAAQESANNIDPRSGVEARSSFPKL